MHTFYPDWKVLSLREVETADDIEVKYIWLFLVVVVYVVSETANLLEVNVFCSRHLVFEFIYDKFIPVHTTFRLPN